MSKALEIARKLVEALEAEQKEGKVQLADLKAGDYFATKIGKFRVLEQFEGSTKVVQADFARKGARFDSESTDYKTSELRALCDGEIYEKYAKAFGDNNIIEHEADLTTVDMQKDFGALDCKVRPLTFDEARQYNALLVNADLPDWYWTCTPWSTKAREWEYSVTVVSPSGLIVYNACYGYGGVRPVCILKSNIFVSKED